jgi:hypothetical protein
MLYAKDVGGSTETPARYGKDKSLQKENEREPSWNF